MELGKSDTRQDSATQRFFPLRLPTRLGGNERNAPYDPERDTDRRACGEVHKAAVTRDHVLLASSGQRDGLIHQNLWRTMSLRIQQSLRSCNNCGAFQAHAGAPKRLAYEKEVNERFAKAP